MKPRVLVLHCAYQQRGGEDSVVEAETALLRARGHEVEGLIVHNDSIGSRSRAAVLVGTFWSIEASSQLRALIRSFRPDVIHVHNTFPLLSPAVYWIAARARVPVVQTLHNFRLLCPQAMLLRNDAVCEDCLGKVPWRGALRGCYRGSVLQSAVLASMVSSHRLLGTWSRKVSRYVALNEFCRTKFIEGGLPGDRIVVKPNFVDFSEPASVGGESFLFVGRLSREKGIHVLAEALRGREDLATRVVGAGPEAVRLEGIEGVNLVGLLDGEGVRTEMCRARALVLPSIWYENFPRTLVEAMGCGLPVIASRLGALAELIDDGVTGLLFDAGDGTDLARKMAWAKAHPEEMRVMGKAARARYEQLYSASSNYALLMDIYADAIRLPLSFD